MDSFVECFREVAKSLPRKHLQRDLQTFTLSRVCVWHLSRPDRLPKVNNLKRRKFCFVLFCFGSVFQSVHPMVAWSSLLDVLS